MSVGIIKHFSVLKDPRIERKKLHSLMDIMVLTIFAMLSGAEGWEAIEEFGHEKEEWLRKYIELKNGIPSHDCIAYVISLLSPNEFQQCFRSWVAEISESLEIKSIRIDGKTLRGSKCTKKKRNPLHLVSAWASEARLVLGQEAVDEKSNEITAIPKLLRLLELKGCVVTIDAMGCQHAIARQIKEQGGDYCISLKGNQSSLHDSVKDFFSISEENKFNGVTHSAYQETDKEHGRLETRKYYITEHLETLPNIEKWEGFKSIGMVIREIFDGEEKKTERRYFINSISANAAQFAGATRGHWEIENRLHWRLDVTLREDACRIRKGNAPAIVGTIRHMCLGLLDADVTPGSLAKKRRKAAWNDSYRASLLFGKNF